MYDVEQRLTKCFSVVFPELSPEEIRKVTGWNAGNLDSLSAVTLLAVVEEEFGIHLEVDDMECFVSFDGLLERIVRPTRVGQS